MKEVDKYLDNLTKKIIKGADLESPSLDFTASVMSQVKAVNSNVTVYKPLISKIGWVFIIASFLVLTVYLIFGTETESSSLLSSIDFSILSKNKITNTLTSFTIPKTFVYAIVLFGLMFWVQIPFLKHHFNQRLEH